MIDFAWKGFKNILAILWFLCNVATVLFFFSMMWVWALGGSFAQICGAF